MEEDYTNSSYSPAVPIGNSIIIWIDVVLLTSNLLAITADAIILFIVLKNKFRKENTYIFILHWSILDIFRLLTSPGTIEWHAQIHTFFEDLSRRRSYICLTVAFQVGIAMLLFVLILKDGILLFKRFYKALIYFIWAVVVTFSTMAVLGGIEQLNFLHYSIMFSIGFFVILVVTLFVICIVSFANETYSGGTFLKLKLAMVFVYACCWLLFIIIVLLSEYFGHSAYGRNLLSLVFYAFAESYVLVNVYVLQKIEPRFRLYFRQVFCCKKGDHQCDETFVYNVHANGNDTV